MEDPDLSMRPALWLGLSQAKALRDAINITLNGLMLFESRGTDTPSGFNDIVERWLKSSGIGENVERKSPPSIWRALNEGFKAGIGIAPDVLVRESNRPSDDWLNLGEERAGAGWRDPANFLITSAFVRLLGASEQYELDVLKSLLEYRPHKLLGHPLDADYCFVECDVVCEESHADKSNPDIQVYSKPPLWTWIRKQAENNNERARIFAHVYNIKTIPPEYKGKQKQEWYEKRNAIAHGRNGVEMTLAEYIDVDVFVAKSMLFLSEQCQTSYKLVV